MDCLHTKSSYFKMMKVNSLNLCACQKEITKFHLLLIDNPALIRLLERREGSLTPRGWFSSFGLRYLMKPQVLSSNP